MARQTRPVQSGETIDYTNADSEAILVGDVVKLGTFCGIAETDIAPGERGAVAISKVWDVPAASGETFAAGDVLYWNGTASTKTAGSDPAIGVCVAPKASSETVARVKIGVVFAS